MIFGYLDLLGVRRLTQRRGSAMRKGCDSHCFSKEATPLKSLIGQLLLQLVNLGIDSHASAPASHLKAGKAGARAPPRARHLEDLLSPEPMAPFSLLGVEGLVADPDPQSNSTIRPAADGLLVSSLWSRTRRRRITLPEQRHGQQRGKWQSVIPFKGIIESQDKTCGFETNDHE